MKKNVYNRNIQEYCIQYTFENVKIKTSLKFYLNL